MKSSRFNYDAVPPLASSSISMLAVTRADVAQAASAVTKLDAVVDVQRETVHRRAVREARRRITCQLPRFARAAAVDELIPVGLEAVAQRMERRVACQKLPVKPSNGRGSTPDRDSAAAGRPAAAVVMISWWRVAARRCQAAAFIAFQRQRAAMRNARSFGSKTEFLRTGGLLVEARHQLVVARGVRGCSRYTRS